METGWITGFEPQQPTALAVMPVFQLSPVLQEIEGLDTAQKAARAVSAIRVLLEGGRPLVIAYSAGKDSSVMLDLVFEAALQVKAAGLPLPNIIVTHANTGIENPAYQTVAFAEISRIRAFAAKHELPLRVDIAAPLFNDTWAMKILSGRGIPTFANSPTRDCSVSLKVVPQERQRKKVLQELNEEGDPVLLVGTRFEESAERKARMLSRGETDVEPWLETVRNKKGDIVRQEARLSPLAFWTQEDVWVRLAELVDGKRQSYTNAKDVWKAYADGGNSGCAVIGDDALKATAKACGARFGCALCAAVGRDKSLEAMIEADPENGYLQNLNRLQRFIVDTQYDLERRNWLGRTIDKDGYIAIQPDTYSPAMLRELLAMSMTIDRDEAAAAQLLGRSPRFELVSVQQLIGIDAVWSAQGIFPRPFEAIRVWEDIYCKGKSVYPPAGENEVSAQEHELPETRYLYVGPEWDDDRQAETYSGLRNVIMEAAGAYERQDQAIEIARLDIARRRLDGERVTKKEEQELLAAAQRDSGCVGLRTLSDGRQIMDIGQSDFFAVDEEAAYDFLQFEVMDRHIAVEYAGRGPTAGYLYYVQLGLLSTTPQHATTIDEMLRRTSWKERHGLVGASTEELLARSISAAEVVKAKRSAGMLEQDVNRESGNYYGAIERVTECEVLQNIGRGVVVAHERAIIEREVMQGDVMDIRYRKGNVAVRIEAGVAQEAQLGLNL